MWVVVGLVAWLSVAAVADEPRRLRKEGGIDSLIEQYADEKEERVDFLAELLLDRELQQTSLAPTPAMTMTMTMTPRPASPTRTARPTAGAAVDTFRPSTLAGMTRRPTTVAGPTPSPLDTQTPVVGNTPKPTRRGMTREPSTVDNGPPVSLGTLPTSRPAGIDTEIPTPTTSVPTVPLAGATPKPSRGQMMTPKPGMMSGTPAPITTGAGPTPSPLDTKGPTPTTLAPQGASTPKPTRGQMQMTPRPGMMAGTKAPISIGSAPSSPSPISVLPPFPEGPTMDTMAPNTISSTPKPSRAGGSGQMMTPRPGNTIVEPTPPVSATTPDPEPSSEPPTEDMIVGSSDMLGLLASVSEFSSYSAAVEASGIANDFGRDSSLTVFAATDAALEAFGTDYVGILVNDPAFILHLRSLVNAHRTSTGAYKASDLTDGLELTMGNGEPATVVVDGSGDVSLQTIAALVNFAPATAIVPRDLEATNGILHQVDTVLAPVWYYYTPISILDVVKEDFSTLRSLITAAGLEEEFAGAEMSTLVAPKNSAFAALPQSTLDYLTDPTNVEALRSVLRYHLLDTLVSFAVQPVGVTTIPTAEGSSVDLEIVRGDGNRAVFSFNGVVSDRIFLTKNSAVYDANGVLVPPTVTLP